MAISVACSALQRQPVGAAQQEGPLEGDAHGKSTSLGPQHHITWSSVFGWLGDLVVARTRWFWVSNHPVLGGSSKLLFVLHVRIEHKPVSMVHKRWSYHHCCLWGWLRAKQLKWQPRYSANQHCCHAHPIAAIPVSSPRPSVLLHTAPNRRPQGSWMTVTFWKTCSLCEFTVTYSYGMRKSPGLHIHSL